jgi:nicotinamide riboside transporter PnuC
MSLSVYLAIAWVFASTLVAMLPMRLQYVPGFALLIAAPVLVVLLGVQHGWLAAVGAVAAFLSMFRNPLRYFWRKWRGLPTGFEPKEEQP